MLKHASLIAIGWMFVGAFGCSSKSSGGMGTGGTGGNGAGSGTVADYCSTSCGQAHGCDNSISEQTCTNTCKNNFAALAPKLRKDFLTSASECILSEDCQSVQSGNAHDKCANEAVAVLSPSATGTSFCTEYESAAEKCNSEFDTAACFEYAKTYNDSSLTEAKACFEGDCASIDACVSATLGDVGAIIVTGPGDGPGPGTGGAGNTGGSGSGSGGRPGTAGSSTGGSDGGGTLSGPCTADSPTECVGASSMNICVAGQYTVMTCADLTAEVGFNGTTCAADVCELGEPTDEACAVGVAVYCVCGETGECTDAEFINFYAACYLDDPAGRQEEAQCLADYAVDGVAMCEAGFTACFGG